MPPRMVVSVATALAAVCSPVSAIVITDVGMVFSENFDSLASSGTGSALPAGWSFAESGTSANGTYATGTGSSNIGNTYSFGASGSSERALGGLQSGTLVPTFGVQILNGSGALIDALGFSYVGEQWRLGALGRADGLEVQYSTDATSLSDGSWTDFSGLDFVAPTTVGSVGALDGNAAANRVALASSLTGLSLANGAALWLRWLDVNAAGSDDGLAIDDFSVVASRTVPSPGTAVPDGLPMAAGLGGVLLGLGVVRRFLSPWTGLAA